MTTLNRMTTKQIKSIWTPKAFTVLAGLLGLQFIAAYVIGTGNYLTNDNLNMFPPIAATAFIPVFIFLATYLFSARFKAFVLGQDLKVLTTIQLWRVMGFVFLPLYSFGILPGLFALPAGIGDVTVGLLAILVVARINKDPEELKSARFLGFHLLGLLDFVTAIVTSSLASGVYPEWITPGITSSPLDVWPLNIFPSFIVPAFIIVQITALLNIRALKAADRAPLNVGLQAA